MNSFGAQGIPFFFLIDFEMKKIQIHEIEKMPKNILFEINHNTKKHKHSPKGKIKLEYTPIKKEIYFQAFNKVLSEINYGNSFLLNLTFPTPIKGSLDLKDIYKKSRARYKLWIEDELVVFSPETFVRIKNDTIWSYPMKGTIDASIANAEEIISKDQKEIAEHFTIVDLIRNDLSMVATNVEVTKFRYAERIYSSQRDLFQISSEIKGQLPDGFQNNLGELFFTMLPAGSISGAPKKKTCEIIRDAEGIDRGYYTGIAGVFDGKNLDSGVMIRLIEKRDDDYYYRSGGGITFQSDAEIEYHELLNKIYVPIY